MRSRSIRSVAVPPRLSLAVLVLGVAATWMPRAEAADGAALYSANCAACHQADAAGQPGQFPALKNRIDRIAATGEGKAYLADVLTHGLSGPIEAGGDSYAGYMPSFARLPDEQIAAILTTLSAMGDSKPAPVITAADIAAGRARNLTAATVHAERATLDAQHKLP